MVGEGENGAGGKEALGNGEFEGGHEGNPFLIDSFPF